MAARVVAIYSPITLAPVLPSSDRLENWETQERMEKKATGATTIFRALRNMVLMGVRAYWSSAPAAPGDSTARRISPRTTARARAPRVR